MLRVLLAFFWALFFALTPSASGQTDWYVDGAAAGPGTGSQGDPFPTILQAINNPAVAHNDRVLVAPGTYVENLDFNDVQLRLESLNGPLATHIVPADPLTPTIHNTPSSSLIKGFTIRDSQTSAIDTKLHEVIQVSRCIIKHNEVGFSYENSALISNTNFTGNECAVLHVNACHCNWPRIWATSCIFFRNTNLECWMFGGGSIHMQHSLVADPLFIAPGDHHLQAGSPCINAGYPDHTDPDGSRVDIGAIPFDPNYPLGESYCTPTANTSGGRAVMAISGSSSLTANDLVLAATRTPADSSGLFFVGTARDYFPLGDGFVCLGGVVARLPVTPTGPTGTPVFQLDNTALPSHAPPIQAGESRGFQYWFRDPLGGAQGWNYSNAVWVVFGP